MGQVLTDTVNRAVSKGWIPSGESQQVIQRIEQLGQKYGFRPDDFAIFSHIESEGLNPKIDNGLGCYGIIQFCPDGGGQKKIGGKSYVVSQIGQMSVLQQMDS